MRTTFFKTIEELSTRHDDIFVLTADLGYKLFDGFREQCSNRFYDIGVAESNMIGVAAGLSLSGKKVYCYSMVPFLVMRAFEQVRVDIAYHNLNVKLVAVGGGFTYGLEGFTHFGLEDLALMRSLPNMTIVVPADPLEAQSLAKLSYEHSGPLYIRLGRTGEPAIHDTLPSFTIGKSIFINEGKNIAILAIGNMVYIGKQVTEMLEKKGVRATLVNIHTLKPFDTETVDQISVSHGAIFSLEEHNVNGGLGSAIAEVLAERGYRGIFRRIGIPENLINNIGDADYLRQIYRLDADGVYNRILSEIEGKGI